MSGRTALLLAWAAMVAMGVLYVVGCDDAAAVKEPPPTPDSGPPIGTDSGSDPDADSGPPPCFTNPTTHFEIINACTTAVKITKNPTLTKLLPDGGLPPLN